MTDQAKKYVEDNLKAWEEVAPIHARHNQARLIEAFSKGGFSALGKIAIERLQANGIDGADIVQICCNNGQELLSTKELGAKRLVGIDGTEGFVVQGRELAAAAGIEAEFIASNIYELPDRYQEKFDIALVTIGVLSWMPDLVRFFEIAAGLLRPGGLLLIHEQHPVIEMMEPGGKDDPVKFEVSYFDETAYVDANGLDYYGSETYDATPNNSFIHKMSDVIMAGFGVGMAIQHFEELPDHISNTWYNVEASGIGMPMSYVLEFRKS